MLYYNPWMSFMLKLHGVHEWLIFMISSNISATFEAEMPKIPPPIVWGWVKYQILKKCSWSQFKIYFTLLVLKCKTVPCTCAKLQLACSNLCGCHAHVPNCSELVRNYLDAITAAVTNGCRTTPNQIIRMEKHPLTNRHFGICFFCE